MDRKTEAEDLGSSTAENTQAARPLDPSTAIQVSRLAVHRDRQLSLDLNARRWFQGSNGDVKIVITIKITRTKFTSIKR